MDWIHFNIRLDDDRHCTRVMIGARPNGEKDLLVVEDAVGKVPKAGRPCCASSSGVAWPPRFSAMVRWASEPHPRGLARDP